MTEARDTELIVLVDDTGSEIGVAPKLASHHLHTPLHKAFSCYIFNELGQVLITQRALRKKVWPGVWTNSVCGHPAPGETDIAAIARRVYEEVGLELTGIEVALPNYRYITPPFNGIIENEICPVYLARAVNEPHANPAEVEAYVWMSWEDYIADIQTRPEQYSYWAKDQLSGLQVSEALPIYAKPVK